MKQTKRYSKWTKEEEEVLLRYVRVYPHNLSKAFLMVSEQLTDTGHPRTTTAVSFHWYRSLSKKPENLCFFTASSKSIAKNRKNCAGMPNNSSIWKRLLNILKSIKL